MKSVNVEQFFDITPLFLAPACLDAKSSPSPAVVTFQLASKHASLQLHKIDFNIEVLNFI